MATPQKDPPTQECRKWDSDDLFLTLSQTFASYGTDGHHKKLMDILIKQVFSEEKVPAVWHDARLRWFHPVTETDSVGSNALYGTFRLNHIHQSQAFFTS